MGQGRIFFWVLFQIGFVFSERPSQLNPPIWPSTVQVFQPNQRNISEMVLALTSSYIFYDDWDDEEMFNTQSRLALLFKPGHYYDLSLSIKSFTQLIGLGKDVFFHGKSFSLGVNEMLWISSENINTVDKIQLMGANQFKVPWKQKKQSYLLASYINHPPHSSSSFICNKPQIIINHDGLYSLLIPQPKHINNEVDDDIMKEIRFENVVVISPSINDENEERVDEKVTHQIQQALDNQLSIVLTPGIYKLSATIHIRHHNQVLFGLGYATLIQPPTQTTPCVAIAKHVTGFRMFGLVLLDRISSIHLSKEKENEGKSHFLRKTTLSSLSQPKQSSLNTQSSQSQSKIDKEVKEHHNDHHKAKSFNKGVNFAKKTSTKVSSNVFKLSSTKTTTTSTIKTTKTVKTTKKIQPSIDSLEPTHLIAPLLYLGDDNVMTKKKKQNQDDDDNDDDDERVRERKEGGECIGSSDVTHIVLSDLMIINNKCTATSESKDEDDLTLVSINSDHVIIDNLFMKTAKESEQSVFLKGNGNSIFLYDITVKTNRDFSDQHILSGVSKSQPPPLHNDVQTDSSCEA